MKANLAITGIGALTPIALNSIESMQSVRSSISRLDVQHYPDRTKKWIVGGRVMTWTPQGRSGRLSALAARALGEAVRQAFPDQPLESEGKVALFVGSTEPIRPGYRFPSTHEDLRGWATQLEIAAPANVDLVEGGSCSIQVELERLALRCRDGEVHPCILGAADTQLQIQVVRWHEDHYRLKCAYMTDGLMPAEGSVFLVVEPEKAAIARGATILARILSVATERESATILGDQPNTAKGLTDAVRTALEDAEVPASDLEMVWCDLNGESYRAREWAFTEIRTGVTDRTQLLHPADCHGDLGAATDANLLALAAMAQATGWSRGKPQLVFAGSEGGIRAATVIGPPSAPAGRGLPAQVSVGLPHTLAAQPVTEPLGPDEVDPAQSEDPPRTYFQWQLRQEHLEEITALYYQRRTILHDAELEWPRVGEAEQRILNHVDAVVAGGRTSIWAVASALLGEEEGACFAAALVLSVLPHPRNFEHLERALVEAPMTRITAIEEALRHARPPDLKDRVLAWLGHPQVDVQAMAIGLVGELRLDEPSCVYAFLDSEHPRLQRRAVQALRRLRDVLSVSQVEQLLTHSDPHVVHEAALAALCLGSQSILSTLRELCRNMAVPLVQAPILLALGGEPGDLDVILQSGRSLTTEGLTALGILGYADAVDPLLSALRAEDDTVKVASAEALDLITGAGLREEAQIRDPEDPELVESVERVCTDWQTWSHWWSAHRSKFELQRRWRRGRPFDLAACVEELSDPHTPLTRRQRAHWELVIHGKQDLPYEADWFVPRQENAMNGWRTWLESR